MSIRCPTCNRPLPAKRGRPKKRYADVADALAATDQMTIRAAAAYLGISPTTMVAYRKLAREAADTGACKQQTRKSKT